MTTRITGSLHPWGAISRAERVRVYASGRVCAEASCQTVLSIYNPCPYCTVHEKASIGLGRRRGEPRPTRECACELCGHAFETSNPARKYCSDRCRMAAFARRKRAAVREQAQSRLSRVESAARDPIAAGSRN
jgi:hypothetical protein